MIFSLEIFKIIFSPGSNLIVPYLYDLPGKFPMFGNIGNLPGRSYR